MTSIVNLIRRCWASLVDAPLLRFEYDGEWIERIPIQHPDLPVWLVKDYYITFPNSKYKWEWVRQPAE